MENIQGQNAPIPTPCNPTPPTQFQLTLKEFSKTLDPLITAAATLQASYTTIANTKKDSVCTSRAASRHIYKAVKEYTLYNNCITMAATKDVEELANTAKETEDKNTKLSASFKTAVDSIKAAKQKIEQVKTLADKLNADIPNSCYSEELKLIKASVSNGGYKKSFEASIAEIQAYVRNITNNVDDVSESAVKVAGINAFINVKSITDAANVVKKGADDFVNDVDANIKSLQTAYEAGKKELADSQKSFSTATLVKYKSVSSKQGLDWVKKLVDNPGCENSGGIEKLNELVKKAAESFNESCAEKSNAETPPNSEEDTN